MSLINSIKDKILSIDYRTTTYDGWDTSLIELPLEDRLLNADKHLNKLYKEKADIEAKYNKQVLSRLNEESAYSNNIKMIDSHIQGLQNEINKFIDSLKYIKQTDTINHEETLKNMEKIIDFAQLLNNKYAPNKTSIFDYINMTGTQTKIDYNILMIQNKKMADTIELMKEYEKPYEYKIKKIDETIATIQREIKLIKNFKTDINKCASGASGSN
jgi:hypothetical protein